MGAVQSHFQSPHPTIQSADQLPPPNRRIILTTATKTRTCNMGALQSYFQSPEPKPTIHFVHKLSAQNARIELNTSGQPSHNAFDKPVPTSQCAVQGKISFLDLPPELRNKVYSQLLTFDNAYMRYTRNQPTKVPALVLLRTCKQIHEEAASLFYAANSFYYLLEVESFAFLRREDLMDHVPKGLLWPAERYQKYVTRMVVDVHISLPLLRGYLDSDNDVAHEQAVSQRQQMIMEEEQNCRAAFFRFYEDIEALWRKEKQRAWTGKMVCSGDRWSGMHSPESRPEWGVRTRVYCMVAFSEDDEVGAKTLLRQC